MENKQPKKERPVNLFYEKTKYLIDKFCKTAPPREQWSRELQATKKLLQMYPDILFWEHLKLDFKLNSLLWFLTEDGREFLKKESRKKEVVLPKQVSYNLDEIKPVTKPVAKNNNSLLDFLK